MKNPWKKYIERLFLSDKNGYFLFDNKIFYKKDIYEKILIFSDVLQSLHIKKGDFIYISLTSNLPFLISFFSCLHLGAIPILNNENKKNETGLAVKLSITHNKEDSNILWNEDSYSIINYNRNINKINNYSRSSFFIHTSGSTNKSKCIGINYKNIIYNIKLHKFLNFKNYPLYSILPWSHIFGLFFDLFLPLYFRINIHRLSNPLDIFSQKKYEPFYINGVPLFFEEIFRKNREPFLRKVRGGVVGGARISSFLSKKLNGSMLRVGYGQTEATPGIFMGKKGEFSEGFLGRDIGVQFKIKKDILYIKGKNIFLESIQGGKIVSHSRKRWVNTLDICKTKKRKFYYIGRSDFSFKLKNGKKVFPEELESNLLEKLKFDSPLLLFENREGRLILMVDKKVENKKDLILDTLPSYLRVENIKIIFVSEWSKDSKGNLKRNYMVEKFGTLEG